MAIERKFSKEDIKEYQFNSFTDLDAHKDHVRKFEFKEIFSKNELLQKPEHQKIIKIERAFAKGTSFKINPIVEEQRGIKQQEINEFEQTIEEEVQKRLELIREEGHRIGYSEGIVQGREEIFNQMKASVDMKLENFNRMLNSVLRNEEEILTNQKVEIYTLIKNLTKWIVLKELKDDGKYVERLLEKILLDIQSRSNLLVLINPNDWSKMPEVMEHLKERLGEIKNIRVEVDDSIETQGMIVESENGIINGTLEEQFKSLDKLFEDVII